MEREPFHVRSDVDTTLYSLLKSVGKSENGIFQIQKDGLEDIYPDVSHAWPEYALLGSSQETTGEQSLNSDTLPENAASPQAR